MGRRFDVTSTVEMLKTPIFSVEKVSFVVSPSMNATNPAVAAPSACAMEHFRIRCSDWVTVLPIWKGHAVLIRQPRIGSEGFVLETPGGGMSPGERDPTVAAARELEEETGLQSQRILSLASINPNPALMTNRCHFFLALDCEPASKRKHFPDAEEMIEPVILPVEKLDESVRHGAIDHSLSSLCIMLALKYLRLPNGVQS